MKQQDNLSTIDFVRKTTEAITVISESTKQNAETLGGIKEILNVQNATNAKSFEVVNGKVDGLLTMFKFVIAPLVTGILALVGVKTLFKL